MASGDEIMVPLGSWQSIMALIVGLLGAGGLGGFLTALIQRPSKRSTDATAAKEEATGEAAVIASIAVAFTGTTASLREEIERMQAMLNELRTRVVEAEAEIRAAAAREAGLERLVADLRAQLETALADVTRLRAERDAAVEAGIQKEGEVRQLKAVIAAQERVAGA
jgi:chromosome segregation ATPase